MPGFWKRAEMGVVFHGSRLNITESCLDRYAKSNPNKLALVFEDEEGAKKEYSYSKLLCEASRFSNLLEKHKTKKSSRVFIFLPKTPELFISFLGTIRQGSIAIPLFEAFQRDGLMLRLKSGEANVIVTNKELYTRLPKNIKKYIPTLREIFVVDSREYKHMIEKEKPSFQPVLKNKKDTAFMIFTSSTAGTPVAGIEIPHYALVQQHMTAERVLGLKKNDNYWCTAHPGWVTGSVYGVIAPLSVGCTSYIYSGHFGAGKWTGFLRRYKISVLYTAPTALRMLKPEVGKSDLKYLRNVYSVGEALTEDVYNFYKSLGVGIRDTYWQTETGAIMIACSRGMKNKSGSMGRPVPGTKAAIKDGFIAFKPGWPSMMTGIYKHKKMYRSYFHKGWFRTNDIAKKDEGGCFYFVGRGGDIIKTSGERISPVEIESVLMKHRAVQEAAVIGVPDKVRGEIIKAFVVLNKHTTPSEALRQELMMFVKGSYAGHSYPKEIEFIASLPKTFSGKVIRMKLRELSSKQRV